MEYKGKRNTECPVCKGNINKEHPMVFRVDGSISSGHLWCNKCFEVVYSAYQKHIMGGRTSNPVKFVNVMLQEIKKAFPIPEGYSIFGFWLATYENSNIGFQVDFRKED